MSLPKSGTCGTVLSHVVFDFINCLTGSMNKYNGELESNVIIYTHVFICYWPVRKILICK